jgi:hypothetical protein
MFARSVGFHDARINCEALALDETCIHPRSDQLGGLFQLETGSQSDCRISNR